MAVTKPSGTLKTYLDTKKTDSRLIGSIERHMLTRELDRSRRQDVLHPSDLVKADYCIRAQYFHMLAPPEPKRHALRLQSIFDTGHGAHAKWQGYIREMGDLFGRWRCAVCAHEFWGTSPAECASCSSPSLRYHEVPLVNESLNISGHADGWVTGHGNPFLIEIKTIGVGTIRMEQPALLAANDNDLNKAWRDIRRPFPTHIRQGQLYLELLRRMGVDGMFEGMQVPTEMVYLYELKADQAYKEFVVQADPTIIEQCLDMAFEVMKAVDTGVPPACTVTSDDMGCSSCMALGVIV